ncbi:MAG TPA: serine--tRNA ligase [Actinobacteria bacterium]|nr:serine--tRNA ligase [Actinomycetota bacterium]
MIDPTILRTDPDRIRESQRRRGEDVDIVDRLIEADSAKRVAQQRFDELRNQQKTLGKQIGPLQGALKKADDAARDQLQAQADQLMVQASALADEVKAADLAADGAAKQADELWLQISNLVNLESPVGGEADFTVLEMVGQPRDFVSEGFEPKDHLDLGESLDAIDTVRGAKVAGSRFFYLKGQGALLEFALLNLAMQQAVSNGFIPMITPAIVLPEAMEGTGFLGQAAENVYRLEQDDLYLVGTSEVPLAAYHSDEIFEPGQLPLRYAGWSSCFRREAGSYGKDTRGIIRVHQFDKVEMFVFTTPEDAEAEHARLLQWERDFMDALEIPYRVIDVATGDLGSSATRKFDIEAWIPTQGTYREVTSTSNTTEFQARRLKIRMRDGKQQRPVATLNGTLCAMPRIIVALLENHQQADGSVRIPKALQAFLGGQTSFTPPA